ncbi:UNVERIFIED_ORG: hypothetical protein ABIB19_002771 [Arthrobacter sp. UYEF10]
MMIPQPDWTCSAEVQDGIAKAETKNVPGLDLLRLETIDEGLSVQILHIGRYDDEAPTLSCLHHEYIPATAPDLPARTTRSTSAMPAGWQRKSSNHPSPTRAAALRHFRPTCTCCCWPGAGIIG